MGSSFYWVFDIWRVFYLEYIVYFYDNFVSKVLLYLFYGWGEGMYFVSGRVKIWILGFIVFKSCDFCIILIL